MGVQSILFSRDKFTKSQAIAWLKKHKYKYSKQDLKKTVRRFRQIDPQFYKRFRIKVISDGICFVLGFN